jgi:hypothetical protein
MLSEMNLQNDDVKKEFIFTGKSLGPNFENNYFLRTVAIQFCFVIWEHKLAKKIPVYQNVLNTFFFFKWKALEKLTTN